MAMAVQRLHKGAQVGAGAAAASAAVAAAAAGPPSLPGVTSRPSLPLPLPLPQVTIGPWTERGFFYDFDMPQPLTEKDLPKIRKEMQKIMRKNLPFVREEVSAAEARARIEASSPAVAAA
jgi:hypothetical protein